jgi:transcriptional regulator with XRE-family HTH domain
MTSQRLGAAEKKRIVHLLRSWREQAGFTQQEVAFRLKKPQSFVAKYETGARSLDFTEFFFVLKALRVAPRAALDQIYEANPSFGPFGVRFREPPRQGR